MKVSDKVMSLYGYCSSHYKVMFRNGDYVERKNELTLPIIRNHLNGGETVSVFARAKSTKFLCFDVDNPDEVSVRTILGTLSGFGIPKENVVISLSGRKGYHIEVFFDAPVWNNQARDLYELVLYFGKLSKDKIELMPSRNHAIKIPLGINHKTGVRCWYVDRETLKPIESMEYVLGIKPVSVKLIASILEERGRERKRELIAGMAEKAAEVPEAPKREYHEPTVEDLGQRHNKMMKYGMRLRNGGADEEAIYKGMLAWCERQPAGLIRSSPEEIERDARKMAAWIMNNIKVSERKDWANTVRIYPDDVQRILAVGSRTARRIAFYLYTLCRVHKSASVSYAMISEAVGCTPAMATRIVNGFVEAGYFRRASGGIRCVGNEVTAVANRYEICEGWKPDRNIAASRFCDVDLDRLKADFDGEYYGAVWHMCDDRTLRKVLSRSEYAETKR